MFVAFIEPEVSWWHRLLFLLSLLPLKKPLYNGVKKMAWYHVLKWRNFLKRDKNKKIKIKEGWLLLQDNISLLLVQLCHPGTKWFGITHWISPAMFLCKSHMINHCLIHNEMQTFAARRHNAELFLHFLFDSLHYTAKLFIIFIFTTSNTSKARRKG